MRICLVVLAVVAACGVERSALDNPNAVVATCDQVWEAPAAAACVFDGTCRRGAPANPRCCTETARCDDGTLELETACNNDCACDDDRGCGNRTICSDRVCTPCPPTDVCPPCLADWVRLTRNGCPTCVCGPAPECAQPGVACAPGNGDAVCYAGQTCSDHCDASQAGCCANTCSAPGCNGPAPLGCLMLQCPRELACAQCATDACECVGGAWVCTAVCIERSDVRCRYLP